MFKTGTLTKEDRAICESRYVAPYVAASTMEASRVAADLGALFAEGKVALWVAANINYREAVNAYFN